MGRTKASAIADADKKLKAEAKATKAKAASKSSSKAAAKPAAAPKGTKTPKYSFVVSQRLEYGNDGFHRYDGPGDFETVSIHKTAKDANKAARDLFYKKNPWGLEVDEIERMDVRERERSNGTLTLWVAPPDSEIWEVKVEMVPHS